MKMYPVFDLHCDTILACADRKLPLLKNDLHIDLQKLKKGGAYAQCFAIFVDKEACRQAGVTPYEKYQAVRSKFREEMAANADLIAQAYDMEQVRACARENKIAAILTVEGGEVLGEDSARIDELYRDGVRLLTLTWNYENAIADANGGEGGLKPFGHEVVERMNETGMLIDVSHISDRSFYDVLTHSKKPVIASHSCARSLCDHSRNLTDEMLHMLGERGGVVGLNFYSRFLRKDSNYATMEQVKKHAEHIVNCAGIDALALGSDYDGISCGLEWENYSKTQQLLAYLAKEFSPAQMEKICCGNAERIFGQQNGVLRSSEPDIRVNEVM